MNNVAFKISGMDCAEEIAVLKREVGPLVGGESALSFDLLQGKMTVTCDGRAVPEEAVRNAVARTGMTAVPWNAAGEAVVGPWHRHGRAVMCTLSGVFLAGAFAWHVLREGWVAVLVHRDPPQTLSKSFNMHYLEPQKYLNRITRPDTMND